MKSRETFRNDVEEATWEGVEKLNRLKPAHVLVDYQVVMAHAPRGGRPPSTVLKDGIILQSPSSAVLEVC